LSRISEPPTPSKLFVDLIRLDLTNPPWKSVVSGLVGLVRIRRHSPPLVLRIYDGASQGVTG
jgi:hypothetical protein